MQAPAVVFSSVSKFEIDGGNFHVKQGVTFHFKIDSIEICWQCRTILDSFAIDCVLKQLCYLLDAFTLAEFYASLTLLVSTMAWHENDLNMSYKYST